MSDAPMATLAQDEVQRDLAIHGNKVQSWFAPKWPLSLIHPQKWGEYRTVRCQILLLKRAHRVSPGSNLKSHDSIKNALAGPNPVTFVTRSTDR